MPRMFEGRLKYEVQNDEQNLSKFVLNRPVMDNKGIHTHLSVSLKKLCSFSAYMRNLSVRNFSFQTGQLRKTK